MKTRFGAIGLVLAGALFVAYPALRPWTDESTVDGAVAAMSSGAWVASHAFAMAGFVLVALGLWALRTLVRQSPGGPAALGAAVTSWIGAGLVLPYYGAEDFGLYAIASAYRNGAQFDLLAMVDAVRYQPLAMTMFGLGLLTLAVSGVLAAVAVWRSGRLSRLAGLPFAAGYVLFLPQFFTPAPARIAHGVVLGIGLAWLGLAMARAAHHGLPSVEVAGD